VRRWLCEWKYAVSLYDVASTDNAVKLALDVSEVTQCEVEARWNVMAHAETRFRLSAKRTSPFKSAGASVQSTAGSRGMRISGSNAGYTMIWGSVKGTGYPLHSPVSPSIPLLCITMWHHISTGVYYVLAVALLKVQVCYVMLAGKQLLTFLRILVP